MGNVIAWSNACLHYIRLIFGPPILMPNLTHRRCADRNRLAEEQAAEAGQGRSADDGKGSRATTRGEPRGSRVMSCEGRGVVFESMCM
jgi:hypothetical protein